MLFLRLWLQFSCCSILPRSRFELPLLAIIPHRNFCTLPRNDSVFPAVFLLLPRSSFLNTYKRHVWLCLTSIGLLLRGLFFFNHFCRRKIIKDKIAVALTDELVSNWRFIQKKHGKQSCRNGITVPETDPCSEPAARRPRVQTQYRPFCLDCHEDDRISREIWKNWL